MKTLIRSIVPSLFLAVVSMACGGVPAMNVLVADAKGKAAFKGSTDAKGAFATGKLAPGNYTVQFNSKSTMKGNQYSIVVAAGIKKVSANGVVGEKFNKGGVALKVDVAPGLNITGQVAPEAPGSVSKSGKQMVWIPKQLGSNMPAHWAEKDSPEAAQARAAGALSTQDVQEMQNRAPGPR